jgi:hypothetical protein
MTKSRAIALILVYSALVSVLVLPQCLDLAAGAIGLCQIESVPSGQPTMGQHAAQNAFGGSRYVIKSQPCQIGINIINGDVNGTTQSIDQGFRGSGETAAGMQPDGFMPVGNPVGSFQSGEPVAINIVNINYGNLFGKREPQIQNQSGPHAGMTGMQNALQKMAERACRTEQERKVNLDLLKRIACR